MIEFGEQRQAGAPLAIHMRSSPKWGTIQDDREVLPGVLSVRHPIENGRGLRGHLEITNELSGHARLSYEHPSVFFPAPSKQDARTPAHFTETDRGRRKRDVGTMRHKTQETEAVPLSLGVCLHPGPRHEESGRDPVAEGLLVAGIQPLRSMARQAVSRQQDVRQLVGQGEPAPTVGPVGAKRDDGPVLAPDGAALLRKAFRTNVGDTELVCQKVKVDRRRRREIVLKLLHESLSETSFDRRFRAHRPQR